MPNFIRLGQKASELGGGKIRPPKALSVFKSPGKIGLKISLELSKTTCSFTGKSKPK